MIVFAIAFAHLIHPFNKTSYNKLHKLHKLHRLRNKRIKSLFLLRDNGKKIWLLNVYNLILVLHQLETTIRVIITIRRVISLILSTVQCWRSVQIALTVFVQQISKIRWSIGVETSLISANIVLITNHQTMGIATDWTESFWFIFPASFLEVRMREIYWLARITGKHLLVD